MPIIPDFKDATGDLHPAAPSVGAATSTGRSLMSAGNAISGAGEEIGAIQQRFQAARDNGIRNHARLLMQQAYDEHQQFRLENPDESTWEADLTQRTQGVQTEVSKEKMSPFLKTEMDEEFAGWQEKNASGVKYDATKQGMARARQRTTNAAEAYKQAGKYDDARKVLESSRGAEFLPEEVDQDLLELDRQKKLHEEKQADDRARNEIAEDPNGWLEKNKGDKVPDGVDAYVYRQRRSYALGLRGDQQQELQDTVREGILNGRVRSEAEIDHLTEDALPSVKERLKQELNTRSSFVEKLRRMTPDYQNKTAGEISSALLDFNPENVEQRLQIDSMISTLPVGATRSHFRDQLSKAIKGDTAEPDTPLSINLRLADGAFKSNFFSSEAGGLHEQKTARLLRAGFIKNPQNLSRLGLSPDQVKGVLEAKDPKKNEVTPEAQLDAFRNLSGVWQSRKNITATPYDQAAAEAIMNGDETVRYIDKETQARALNLYGKVKTDTIRWAAQNKDASVDDIRAHMLKIAAPGAADAFIDAAFDSETEDPTMVLPPLESDDELKTTLPPLDR